MTNEQAKACAEEILANYKTTADLDGLAAIIQRHAGKDTEHVMTNADIVDAEHYNRLVHQLNKIRKDTERLDWLNTTQQGLTACFGFAPMGTGKPLPFEGWLIGTTSGEPEFTDIRQAIDAARNQLK